MPINKIGTEYIIEIQNGEKSEGIFAVERLLVRVHNNGGGPFLAIRTENLEPTDEYDEGTVTLSRQDITCLATALEDILTEHEDVD
jgi:hypothetical protein